jgi:putative transposase
LRALVVPITGDKSGRWHIAFAVIPDPVAAPGTGGVVTVEGGVAVAAELSLLLE